MKVEVFLDFNGFWAWMDANPGRIREQRIANIVRKAHRQAWAEWCGDAPAARGQPKRASLAYRFDPNAFAGLRLRSRTPAYKRWQQRWLGKVVPYFSPRNTKHTANSWGGRVEWTSRQGPHMKDATLSKAGHRVALSNGAGTQVKSTLFLAGARRLNLIDGENKAEARVYRRQFLGFGENDPMSAKWIARRVTELALADLTSVAQRTRRRRSKKTRAA